MSGDGTEPRAGYYVQTSDRPKFVTDFSDEDFDAVFSLMREDHERWALRDAQGGAG